jgi:hypothetical protein
VDRLLGLVGLPTSDAALMAMPPEARFRVREALYQHPSFFGEYLERLDRSISPDAAQIVEGWRDHHIRGSFYLLRHLAKYAVFSRRASRPGRTASSAWPIRSRRSFRTRPPWSTPSSCRSAVASSTTAISPDPG